MPKQKPHLNEVTAWQFVEEAVSKGETPNLAVLYANMETPAEAKARIEERIDQGA